ncbi:acyltransferase family protein [Actinomadura adrarensis]|uniref:Acyltransferase family protein n=1 Tax=Actinomadura adrarensis TaxID=1819600 RepID=A0ABW3CRP5_9ACTN
MPAKINETPARPQVRLTEVDLLRFLAALAVVAYHYTGSTAGPWEGDESARDMFGTVSLATQFGFLGVELFFIISGFVILMSVWGRTMAQFAVSRIVRLYPAYWFAVLLIGAIYLTTGMGRGYPQDIIPNLTMFQTGMGVQNANDVFWTLWIEMHFYALIALLVLAGLTYQRCVTFMASWTVLAIFAEESGNDFLYKILIPHYAPYFIAGMAFYLIYRFGSNIVLWGLVAFSWATSVRHALPNAVDNPYSIPPADAWPAIPVLITLIYAVMALVAIGALRKLNWKHLATLGALTYPTYLIHHALGPVLARPLYPLLPLWAALAVMTAIVLAAAYLIHRLIERPLSRWLKPRLTNAFERIRLTEPGRTPTKRPRLPALTHRETPPTTPNTREPEPQTADGRTPQLQREEGHGSTPSPPIGSTI